MSSPTDTRADVIVVGSGSGGAATARRLLDAGMTVLLLEAGGADTNEAIHVPARVHELWFGEEDWAYQGNDGWCWQDVLPLFIAMEDYDRGASERHGTGGPIHIDTSWEPTALHRAFERAAAEIGIPRNDDCNGERQEGFSYVQSTVVDARRRSTTAAYLAPVSERCSRTGAR